MKLLDLRKQIKQEFKDANIEETDADFIIAEVLGVKRTELSLIENVDDEKLILINDAKTKRLNKIPVEKIFGKSYFYGLQFNVSENVLSPRPETELLVDTAIKYINDNNYKKCLDLCTGSGCIAIAIKKNCNVEMNASDVSKKALSIAKQNAKLNDVNIEFIESNMFNEINEKFDIIVSNPPYIDSNEIVELDEEVKFHDPLMALDGGAMGLDYYNIIHDNLRKYLLDGGILIMEIGENQKDLIVSLFNDFQFIDCLKDYNNQDRIIIFKK